MENGKREKSFFQRRPHGGLVDDQPRAWINGLQSGTYLRNSIDGNYYLATDDRLAKPFWRDAERIEVEESPHMLFRLPELREELAQDVGVRRTIFLEEGEKNCETLVDWGCVATTNSGGAKHWLPEELRGADVVILENNDKAGRGRTKAVTVSLNGVATIKVLRWPEHWPECPEGGDVTDWRDQAGGDADKFFEIVEGLPERAPSDDGAGDTAVTKLRRRYPSWICPDGTTRIRRRVSGQCVTEYRCTRSRYSPGKGRPARVRFNCTCLSRIPSAGTGCRQCPSRARRSSSMPKTMRQSYTGAPSASSRTTAQPSPKRNVAAST
jgi:hypothetical protein